MSEIKWKGQYLTHQVNQNKTGDTFSRSDLAKSSDNRIDQEPEISIRDCTKSGVLF